MTKERERETFETEFGSDGKWPAAIERDKNGNYKLMAATNAWVIWQRCCMITRATDTALIKELQDALRAYQTGTTTNSLIMDAWDSTRTLLLQDSESDMPRSVFEQALEEIEEKAETAIRKAEERLGECNVA